MKENLEKLIKNSLVSLGIEPKDIVVEHPDDLAHGDYMTNAALMYAKEAGKNPRELAGEIVKHLAVQQPSEIEKIEIAGPGFINFYLSKEFFKKSIGEIIEGGEDYGKNEKLKGEKVIVEHTDPNPFKQFHIGHLMPNVIGSTIARLYRWNGAEVKEAVYQGDVGIHVAKAIWGFLQGERENAYPVGNKAFEENEQAKEEIKAINKKIYDRSDSVINEIYDKGREASLEYFESIYKRLGTHFDFYFFESKTAEKGKEIVEKNIGKVFEESDGAVVFHAEKYNPSLHTRVFINSEGLPTYEAKELGLAPLKFETYPYTRSIVVTGNEINDYFKVLLEAMNALFPDLRQKTAHVSHGMLRLPTGKMSSRTGDVLTAESLIEEVKKTISEKGDVAQEEVALGAIKYMILRQSIGGDIIFDFEKSVSTEGDSGVYLQYAHARTNSILQKAGKEGDAGGTRETLHEVEKLLYRFPEVVERSLEEYAPHLLVTYLTTIAGSFNNLYSKEQIIDSPESDYLLALTKAFNIVMKNGLTILGIPTPEKM